MSGPEAHPDDRTITLRRAEPDDSHDLWQWRNDEKTRLMSVSVDAVAWEDHSIWYAKIINDKNIFLYVATLDGYHKIGMCRFDVKGDFADVSLNINPDYRNRRLSYPLLSLAIERFFSEVRVNLRAKIKNKNIASIKCFRENGFLPMSKESDYTNYSLPAISPSELEEKMKLIDEIEKIRTANNVNWMDLLRLAFRSAPEETKQLIRRINTDDNRISQLFAKLGE